MCKTVKTHSRSPLDDSTNVLLWAEKLLSKAFICRSDEMLPKMIPSLQVFDDFEIRF